MITHNYDTKSNEDPPIIMTKKNLLMLHNAYIYPYMTNCIE